MQIEEFVTEEFGMKNHHSSLFFGSSWRGAQPIQQLVCSFPSIQNT
jgi:hypothetical protein